MKKEYRLVIAGCRRFNNYCKLASKSMIEYAQKYRKPCRIIEL